MAELERTAEQKTMDNVKSGIKAIEGLFHACNAASFPLKWHDAVMEGMKMMNAMHTQLLGQLPSEEIAKEKASQEALAKEPIAPTVVN